MPHGPRSCFPHRSPPIARHNTRFKMSPYTRTEEKALSFRGEQLLRGRHRIHPYPAMLHPLLVNFLIDVYGREGDVVFDPFCGSGVTLLQAAINGYESIGFDINPLAVLIARAKTTTYRNEKLIEEFNDLKDSVHRNTLPLFGDDRRDIPPIKNREHWYSKSVANDLGSIRYVLKNKPYQYQDFFLTSFAFVCRNQSFTRNGEFKRYKMREEIIAKTKNEALPKFFSHVQEMIDIFSREDIPKKNCKPMLVNSENRIPAEIKYDLVVTSPPYGDSRTTVAYGQYTSFGSEWVNGLNGNNDGGYKVDSECLGKQGRLNEELSKHEILTNTLERIRRADRRRSKDVLYFFNGYYNAIRNIAQNLNEGGRVCLVVGNRTVKACQIPMDQISASFLDSMGLNFKGIFVREIHNKVMPSKNSPSNKVGVKSKTMSNEYIVVFSKD